MQTPLTIELVPRTCWFKNVRSEVSAEDWNKLKKMTAQAAGNRCEICGGRGPRWPVEAHEVWHYDDRDHVQKLAGLVALCPDCHSVKHMGLTISRGREEQALRHLARVNGWSVEDARLYVEVAFEVWSQRSNHDWTLDISWLEQHGVHPKPR